MRTCALIDTWESATETKPRAPPRVARGLLLKQSCVLHSNVVLRAIAAVLVLGLTLPSVALARASSVHVLLSPTRRGDAQALRDQAVRVSRLLASRTGSVVLAADDGDPSREEQAILQRAERLAASGALDDAAAVFDAALDTATHAPSRVADAAGLVTAHVTRASIALARGE